MSVSVAVQAAAELERRKRLAGGNRVAVIIQYGDCWRYRDQLLDDAQAAELRRNWRGTWVTVHRIKMPLPA